MFLHEFILLTFVTILQFSNKSLDVHTHLLTQPAKEWIILLKKGHKLSKYWAKLVQCIFDQIILHEPFLICPLFLIPFIPICLNTLSTCFRLQQHAQFLKIMFIRLDQPLKKIMLVPSCQLSLANFPQSFLHIPNHSTIPHRFHDSMSRQQPLEQDIHTLILSVRQVKEIYVQITILFEILSTVCWTTDTLHQFRSIKVGMEVLVVVESGEIFTEMIVFQNLHSIQLLTYIDKLQIDKQVLLQGRQIINVNRGMEIRPNVKGRFIHRNTWYRLRTCLKMGLCLCEGDGDREVVGIFVAFFVLAMKAEIRLPF